MRAAGLLLAAGSLCAAAEGQPQKQARESFRVACVRCHGEDGSLENYPGVKRLDGIGKRLSKAEIAKRLHPMPLGKDQVTVRNHVLTEEQFRRLVDYLATL